MDILDYQKLAMRTSPEGHDRILNGCLGLIGEAGEIVDAVKKWKFQSGDDAQLPTDKLIDECGDVLWYCAELASGMGENLAVMYEKAQSEFDDIREINKTEPVYITAGRLAAIAVNPFITHGRPDTEDENWILARRAEQKAEVVGIMTMVRDILEFYCGSSLNEAMEKNIEKLKKRYPDGFDPERSLHREQEA